MQPTEKQLEVWLFLVRYVEKHGFQPSLAEMGLHFGVDKRAIHGRLKELEAKGFIKLTSEARAIILKHVKFEAIADTGEETAKKEEE